MLFKANEISEKKLVLSKNDAKTFVSGIEGVPNPELLDRFNLESFLNAFFKGKVKVLPSSGDGDVKLNIGYGFNYCYEGAVVDTNVTKNLLEIPLLKEFLARGSRISFIGKSELKFDKFHPRMENFSAEWKKLPKPYRPVSDWIEDCVENYEKKYEMELPDVDFVIMNAFPSFFFSNMMFYLINLHYAKKNIPVFLWDIEFRTLRSRDSDFFPKVFRYSGADRIFSDEDFKKIASNSYWLLQIPGEAMGRVRKLNPDIRVLPFFPPYWFRDDLGLYRVKKNPLYRIIYVGNDSERRKTIKKFFTPLSKKNRLHVFGGGMSRRSKGYEKFDAYLGNMKMHGPIPQEEVWRTYNLSRTCLSVARQRYYDVGFIVHRWLEVVLGGSILLLPRDLYGVEKYFYKGFLVEDSDHLEERINFFNDEIKFSKLVEANEYQRKFIFRTFSSEKGVNTILRTIGK